MSKPKTDEEALAACFSCRRKTEKVCELVGEITVASRHQCYLAGYADWRPQDAVHYGKLPKFPPQE